MPSTRFRALPPEEKARIRENFRRFQNMPREQREQLRNRWRNLSPEQRGQVRDRWRQLTPEQRDRARDRRGGRG